MIFGVSAHLRILCQIGIYQTVAACITGSILSLLLFTTPSLAADPLLIGTSDSYPLGRTTLEMVADPDHRLTISDISSPAYASRFKPVPADSPNFGISTAVYWFRFNIDFGTRSQDKWLLLLDQPLMDYADLYLVHPDGTVLTQHSGDMRPMASRTIQKRSILFSLHPREGSATWYLRAQISGRSQFPLTVCTGDAMNLRESVQNSIYAGFTGFALTIAVISMSLYLFIREKSFVYYAFYILATAAYHLTIAGYLFSQVFPSHPRTHDYLATLICFLPLLGATFFIREFLITPKNAPVMDRLLRIWIWANLILPPLIFFVPAAPFKTALMLDAMLIVLFLLAASAEAVRNGYPPAKYLLAARILHEIAVLLLMLLNFNLIPYSPFYETALLITPLLDGILIAFAQGERFKLLSSKIGDLVADLQLQISERTAAHGALQEQMEKHERLEQEIQQVSREERRRISHELHDGLCQQLTGARLRFAALEDRLTEAGLEPEARPLGTLLQDSVDHAYALSRRLWTSDRDGGEGVIDLEQLVRQASSQSAIPIQLEMKQNCPACSAVSMLHIQQIAREALTNAVKHSGATLITIALHCTPDTGIQLEVSDNGCGITTTKGTGGGLGIGMMEYRATQINARFEITDLTGRGTSVVCTAPCAVVWDREATDA
ncbi:Signal transduction histidine kinase [Trichlorobacter thiogenes]|uniref:histidine kinase n=1 Tax=Trichlorobacter thiogenes TaxID=115783 RepID=A0A1T4P9I6_9BACT|nr:7TM-DISM domain-containing protein [Trichlorobacter thiogenes]SJZ88119.1 Signal transduction histidine kinase [Trichlorobacter thiogenes]